MAKINSRNFSRRVYNGQYSECKIVEILCIYCFYMMLELDIHYILE